MDNLSPPHVIAWRLIWWPIAMALRLALTLAVMAGWGYRQGLIMWDQTD